MSIFSRKSFFLIGSILGSAAGLLMARESGTALRRKLENAKDPQKKFEIFFQEYLQAGKKAVQEIAATDTAKDLVSGGKEILKELEVRAKKEGGEAIKIAEKKTKELIRELEKQTVSKSKTIVKKGKSSAKKAIRATKKAVKKTAAKKPAARKPAAKKKVATKKKPARRTSAKK